MINYDQLFHICKKEFLEATPFPHVVIDNFLVPGYSERIAHGFPKSLHKVSRSKRKAVEGKAFLSNTSKMTEPQRKFFEEANSHRFLEILSEITGIEPLYPDPNLKGGGLHETINPGFLKIHTDFNKGNGGKHRALNLLVFLNPYWEEEWGGSLELWTDQAKEKVHTIHPLNNRAILFRASEHSFHGHPKPLNAPKGVTRKSLAVYYYENWPKGVTVRPNTNYIFTEE